MQMEMHEEFSLDEDEREKAHFMKIVTAMGLYRVNSLQRVSQTESFLETLSPRHQELLKRYKGDLEDVKRCIEKNYEVIELITKDVATIFQNVDCASEVTIEQRVLCSWLLDAQGLTSRSLSFKKEELAFPSQTSRIAPDPTDMEKVQSTLKQIVRDWSLECAAERQACYQPIIDEIVSRYPPDSCTPEKIHILVPGAGLGRLAHEIAMRGYTCQGNEFSLFMLFASNFVLNRCKGTHLHKIYPWVHQFVNNLSAAHQVEGVTFPDINPSELPKNAHFSMTAGDFLEVYTESNEWNCIATCFFIDCANNIVAFIETIYNILKPGGLWVNLGPLLYHYSDIPNENSIEPSYEVVREIIQKIGFEIQKEDKNKCATYAQNPRSMMKFEYNCVFFVCRKPK